MSTNGLDSLIEEELIEAEKKRMTNSKSVVRMYYIFLSISAVGIFVILIGGFALQLLLIPFFLALIPVAISLYLKMNLVKQVKNQLLYPILKKLRPDLTYSSEGYITVSQFEDSNLFTRPDRYKGEDLLTGKSDKTTFSFSEIHAEEKRTSSSNGKSKSTYSTIFKGIFMIADFNKHIKSETYVLTTGGKYWSKFKRVKVEDPLFEKRFDVYSNDQIEARYILTPSMMSRIVQLEERFNCQLFLSFRGNHVNIALGSSVNYFEPDVSQEITREAVEKIIKEMDDCISIIEDLDLNTRIWTKE